MKIALYQYAMKRGWIDENVAQVHAVVAQAAEAGVDLLLLPEFWAIGWDLSRVGAMADAPHQGVFAQMSAWAKQYGIGIGGTHPCRIDGSIRNRFTLWGPDSALLADYDKMHLFSLMDEHRYVAPGQSITLAETPWGRLGLAVCFDLRFPELFRQLALKGAELILVPAYWPSPRLDHWRLLLKARAVENQCFIAGVNRATSDGRAIFGHSAIIGPDGRVVTEAGTDEMLLIADIDIKTVAASRQDFPAMAGRRHGEYGEF